MARGATRAGLIAAVLLVCAGCTSTPIPSPTVTVTAATTPTATVTATASASPIASPSPRTDPDAPKGQCTDDHLAVSVQPDPDGGGGGHTDVFVVLRNTGTTGCVLEGAPGVSLVGHEDGTQLGRPAARIAGAATPVVPVAAGDYAIAVVLMSVVTKGGGIYSDGKGHDPTCQAAHADGYRVYPPHSFEARFVPESSVYACTTDIDWIQVQPVQHRVTGFRPAS